MNKCGIANRLSKCGLRNPADAYREEVRMRLKATGVDRDAANAAAWQEMWDTFRPSVEKIEKEREEWKKKKAAAAAKPSAPKLIGLPDDINSSLDVKYAEEDSGKQIRDGLLWTAFEWMRVIRDTDKGPVADLSAASSPPPNAFALFTLSAYALSPAEKRRDLIMRVMAFAAREHDTPPEEPDEKPAEDGFLDKIS